MMSTLPCRNLAWPDHLGRLAHQSRMTSLASCFISCTGMLTADLLSPAGTQPLWAQCGGVNMPGVACTPSCKDVAYVNCVAGAYCARGNPYYWQFVTNHQCKHPVFTYRVVPCAVASWWLCCRRSCRMCRCSDAAGMLVHHACCPRGCGIIQTCWGLPARTHFLPLADA